jgi:hypothetical protein
MKHSLATAVAMLSLTACGATTASNHPSPTFPAPVGAPPRYLGPATTSSTAWDGSRIEPPPAHANPTLGVAKLIKAECATWDTCHTPNFSMTVTLASVTEMNGESGPGADQRLMYVVEETGIPCNTIAVSPMPGRPAWPAGVVWCRSIGFRDANGSELPRWGGVSPMPGQQ